MKKLISLVLALAMIMMVGAAFAQTVSAGEGPATITISNAAKGVHYTVTKIFDATYNTTTNTIAYTYSGTLAENDYFAQNATTGEITAKDDATDESGNLTQAAATWLKNNVTGTAAVTNQENTDGGALVISGLAYGYYLVSSDQGTGSVLSVSSTNPNATMKDKNTTEPTLNKYVATGSTTTDGDGNTTTSWGKATNESINVGVQYKVVATTANWYTPKNATEQKQVISYTIGDNLASNKLTLVSIDSIKVGGSTVTLTPAPTAFPITIPWATNSGTTESPVWTSNYANGAQIEIIYTAKLNNTATIDTIEANENVADLNWTYTDNNPHFGKDEEHLHDSTKTETYGIAFVKVNKEGTKLAGAEFSLPFAATKVEGSDNTWVYTGTGTTSVTTTSTGAIVVKGLKAGDYTITETKAPDGYNKLAGNVTITAQKISSTTSVTRTDKYWKYDSEGNKFDEVASTESYTTSWSNPDFAVTAIPVLNLEGTLLPSTGGIGTTIFYIVGGLLLVGAAIVLVARRKAND